MHDLADVIYSSNVDAAMQAQCKSTETIDYRVSKYMQDDSEGRFADAQYIEMSKPRWLEYTFHAGQNQLDIDGSIISSLIAEGLETTNIFRCYRVEIEVDARSTTNRNVDGSLITGATLLKSFEVDFCLNPLCKIESWERKSDADLPDISIFIDPVTNRSS